MANSDSLSDLQNADAILGGGGTQIDSDPTLAANSDTKIPTQKAVKTYTTYDTDDSYLMDDTTDLNVTQSMTAIEEKLTSGPGSPWDSNGQEFIAWRTALANRGTTPLNIWCLGDSYTAGLYASNRDNTWTQILEARLNKWLGYNDPVGWVCASPSQYKSSDIWVNTGTVDNVSHTYGPGLFAADMAQNATISASVLCDRIHVLYPQSTGLTNRTFKVTIDGVDVVTGLSNTGTTLNSYMWDSGQLTRDEHVVTITATGTSGAVIEGAYFFDGNYDGVRVINAGHSGYYTSQIFAGTTRTQYDGMRSTVLPPALVFIECMGNDIIFGVDVDVWRTTLEDGIDEVRSKCDSYEPTIVLCMPHTTDATEWLDPFRQKLYQVAREKNCVLLDWYQILGNIEQAPITIDSTQDDLHLNDVGMKALGENISQWLIHASGMPSPAEFNPVTDMTWSTLWWANDPDWTNPGDGIALVNGTGLRDASGNSHDLSTVNGTPLFRKYVAALNYRSAIEFDGVNEALQTAGYNPPDQPMTLVAIVVPDAAAASRRIIDSQSAGSQNALSISSVDALGLINTGGSQDSGLVVNETQASLLTGYLSGASSFVTLNGTKSAVLASVGSSGNATGWTVGYAYNGGADFSGKVAFAATYAGDITTDINWEKFKDWVEEYYGIAVGNNIGTNDKLIVNLPVNGATNLSAGDGQAYYRVPLEYNGYKIVRVLAARASGTGTPSIQINNTTQAVDVLSTNVTIDTSETDSTTAATPVVINTSNNTVRGGDRLRVDIDASGTTTLWLEVQLILKRP